MLALRELAVQRGEFILSSGRSASYYVDASKACLHRGPAEDLSEIVSTLMSQLDVNRLGGPLTGAICVASAAMRRSSVHGAFLIRDNYKAHGTGGRLVGADPVASTQCLLVDDVASSGGTLVEAYKWLLQATMYQPVAAYAIVDRDKGARDRLADECGIDLYTTCTMFDLGVEDEQD